MEREKQLEFCKICNHREMDFHKGLLCGLTKELADFEEVCESFDKDLEAEKIEFKRKIENTGDHITGDHYDYKKNKSQGFNKMAAGVFLSFLTFLISDYTGVYIITVGIIIYGFRQYNRGVEQEKIYKEEEMKNRKDE